MIEAPRWAASAVMPASCLTALASPARRSIRLKPPITACSTLLKSWAMPPASWPSASIRCACASRASACSRSRASSREAIVGRPQLRRPLRDMRLQRGVQRRQRAAASSRSTRWARISYCLRRARRAARAALARPAAPRGRSSSTALPIPRTRPVPVPLARCRRAAPSARRRGSRTKVAGWPPSAATIPSWSIAFQRLLGHQGGAGALDQGSHQVGKVGADAAGHPGPSKDPGRQPCVAAARRQDENAMPSPAAASMPASLSRTAAVEPRRVRRRHQRAGAATVPRACRSGRRRSRAGRRRSQAIGPKPQLADGALVVAGALLDAPRAPCAPRRAPRSSAAARPCRRGS